MKAPKPGSKYHKLHEHLINRRADGAQELRLTINQIEKLLGRQLPEGARLAAGWWGNRASGSGQANAWLSAGWQVRGINFSTGEVVFEVIARKLPKPSYVAAGVLKWTGDMIRTMRDTLGWNQIELADALQIRQQTISEWEQGKYEPKRASCLALTKLAEERGFRYGQTNKETNA